MADLPPERLANVAPFTNTGLDIFGPFMVQDGVTTRQRKADRKVWAVLFTCLSSRAIHIEVISSMDTNAFKNALRRFFALRGTCKSIRSDQGTNIIGAQNQDMDKVSLDELKSHCDKNGIEWKMNPPHASHFGGAWERKIGSVRRVLEAALLNLKGQPLTRDELATLMSEAAAIVNATPLWESSPDPNDPRPLTPAMLLTLKEEPHPPTDDDFTEQDVLAYGRKRWRRVQHLADQFWKEWQRSYLSTMQERRKWLIPKRNIAVGDIVLLREKNQKRNVWPMAKVDAVKTSPDGLVRSATVVVPKTGTDGQIRRHFTAVCGVESTPVIQRLESSNIPCY